MRPKLESSHTCSQTPKQTDDPSMITLKTSCSATVCPSSGWIQQWPRVSTLKGGLPLQGEAASTQSWGLGPFSYLLVKEDEVKTIKKQMVG